MWGFWVFLHGCLRQFRVFRRLFWCFFAVVFGAFYRIGLIWANYGSIFADPQSSQSYCLAGFLAVILLNLACFCLIRPQIVVMWRGCSWGSARGCGVSGVFFACSWLILGVFSPSLRLFPVPFSGVQLPVLLSLGPCFCCLPQNPAISRGLGCFFPVSCLSFDSWELGGFAGFLYYMGCYCINQNMVYVICKKTNPMEIWGCFPCFDRC